MSPEVVREAMNLKIAGGYVFEWATKEEVRAIMAVAYNDAARIVENMGHSNGRIRGSHKHAAAAIRAKAKEHD